jgi:hypothetical protein
MVISNESGISLRNGPLRLWLPVRCAHPADEPRRYRSEHEPAEDHPARGTYGPALPEGVPDEIERLAEQKKTARE